MKTITRASKTVKQLSGNNNSNKTNFYSDAGIYRICCQDCSRSYIGETYKSLPKRINEHRKNFKSGHLSNALVIHNISTNYKFDFKHHHIQ